MKLPALFARARTAAARSAERAAERYFYRPNALARVICALLWPLSLLYGAAAERAAERSERFAGPIAVFSVGNLVLGGSGKSPFCRALVKYFLSAEFADAAGLCAPLEPREIAIILRGYGRKSRGFYALPTAANPDSAGKSASPDAANLRAAGEELHLVAAAGNPDGTAGKTPAELYGDEACEHRDELPGVQIFVCESRRHALEIAVQKGCKIAVLDDAFRHFGIQKFDFLLENPTTASARFCLPAGPLRLPRRYRERADFIAFEGRDFVVTSSLPEPEFCARALLVSAIARPERLAPLADRCAGWLCLGDHAAICEAAVREKMRECGASAVVCTGKDWPKLGALQAIAKRAKVAAELGSAAKSAAAEYYKTVHSPDAGAFRGRPEELIKIK